MSWSRRVSKRPLYALLALLARRRAWVMASMVALLGCAGPDLNAMKAADLAGAMATLESNLAAIHARDAEAYLTHYLNSPDFVVATSRGIREGYVWFAEARRASDQWPDTFIVDRPTFRWIAPGVVWGAFSYRAVEGRDTTTGVSERLFVRIQDGWKIAVTGSMEQ